jgi:hypothetical protein
VIDTWLLAHSISQPPTIAGGTGSGGAGSGCGIGSNILSLVAAAGSIAASTVIPSTTTSTGNSTGGGGSLNEVSFANSNQVSISRLVIVVT